MADSDNAGYMVNTVMLNRDAGWLLASLCSFSATVNTREQGTTSENVLVDVNR